jgi:hypothetical protein
LEKIFETEPPVKDQESTPATEKISPVVSLSELESFPEIKTKVIEIESPEEMAAALTLLQTPSAPLTPPPVEIKTPPPIIESALIGREEIAPPVLPTIEKEPAISASPSPVAPPSSTGDAITTCLTQLLKSRPAAKPKLVIIGREGVHVSPMVRQLLGAESSLRRLQSANFQYLEIGERKVDSQPFEIIGISMEQQFTRLLDTAGADLIGYIVMIEAHRKERIEYLSYLLNMLKNVYRRPLGIAMIKSAEQKNMSADTLRFLLKCAPNDFLQECLPNDKSSVTAFLKGYTGEENLQRWNAEIKKDVQIK